MLVGGLPHDRTEAGLRWTQTNCYETPSCLWSSLALFGLEGSNFTGIGLWS